MYNKRLRLGYDESPRWAVVVGDDSRELFLTQSVSFLPRDIFEKSLAQRYLVQHIQCSAVAQRGSTFVGLATG